MFCRNCGACLNDGDKFCPNCGTPVAVSYQQQGQVQGQSQIPAQPVQLKQSASYQPSATAPRPEVSNGFGIAGFVFAILGIFLSVFSLLGLIFSGIGISREKRCTKYNKLADAGLVINILVIIIYVILIAVALTVS